MTISKIWNSSKAIVAFVGAAIAGATGAIDSLPSGIKVPVVAVLSVLSGVVAFFAKYGPLGDKVAAEADDVIGSDSPKDAVTKVIKALGLDDDADDAVFAKASARKAEPTEPADDSPGAHASV